MPVSGGSTIAPMTDERPERRGPGGASLHLGRFFGIDVNVHWTFWLLFIWVAFITFTREDPSVRLFLYYGALVVSVFACVVLHEYGHALTARRFGVETRDITLLPIGGVARLQRMPERPLHEFLVAVAGPAVNVVIAVLLFAIILPLGLYPEMPEGGEALAPRDVGFLLNLAAINVFLVVFNMIPAFPMDGGRVLRAALSAQMDRVRATAVAASIGQALAVGLFALGLFTNPILLLIAIFVFFGGRAEAEAVARTAAFRGVTAGEAAMTRFESLRAGDTLRDAAEELLAGSQHEFPVVDDARRPVGVLTRDELVRGMGEKGEEALVRDAMRPSTLTLEAGAPLRDAIDALDEAGVSLAPIVEGGRVTAVLTLENAHELAALHRASMEG